MPVPTNLTYAATSSLIALGALLILGCAGSPDYTGPQTGGETGGTETSSTAGSTAGGTGTSGSSTSGNSGTTGTSTTGTTTGSTSGTSTSGSTTTGTTSKGNECDETYVPPPGECNPCSCQNGYLVCTDLYCPPTCEEGATKPAGDNCNDCTCVDGNWLCSLRPCEVPVECGARAGDTCTKSEYCAYELGQLCGAADAQSVCKPRPEACDSIYAPVCGCDGKTYSSDCVAASAGTGVRSEGVCGLNE